MTTALDARYGRTPGRRRRAIIVAVVAGAAVLATAVAWVIWVGLFTPNASVRSEDVGSTPIDASTIQVVSQISADPGAHVHCSVKALTEGFAIVGWKVIALPPTDRRVQRVTTIVRTTQPAVSGLIGSCWVT